MVKDLDNNNPLRILLDASCQGVKRLFVLAFDNADNGNEQVEKTCYNILIDGRKFYDQPTDQIKKYDEIKKIATRQGDDYTTGCLLHYQCFKDHYQSIAVDLSKHKSQVCKILEKTKETVLEFYKGTATK